MKSRPRKSPPSEHIPNPLKEESLRKHPYSYIGHWKKTKDGMLNDVIEGEQNHLEANPIFSALMPTLNVSSKPISQLILDPDEP
jgi:hypothetical protein